MKFKATTIICIALALAQVAYSQKQNIIDYYTEIKKDDVSKLWCNDVNAATNDSSEALLPEPLGFIGNHYQRFYIHYTSVAKSNTNPHKYIVTGKTKVKENICNFTGTITVVSAGIFKEQEEKYQQGFVTCDIVLYEDSTQKETGLFKGKLTSMFYLDESNKIQYDDLMIGADGYFNNQCEATWTSYTTAKTKICNWGDYRIPKSKALDAGDGEFAVGKQYDLFGWKNYRVAWSDDPSKKGTAMAREAENKHWWQ